MKENVPEKNVFCVAQCVLYIHRKKRLYGSLNLRGFYLFIQCTHSSFCRVFFFLLAVNVRYVCFIYATNSSTHWFHICVHFPRKWSSLFGSFFSWIDCNYMDFVVLIFNWVFAFSQHRFTPPKQQKDVYIMRNCDASRISRWNLFFDSWSVALCLSPSKEVERKYFK